MKLCAIAGMLECSPDGNANGYASPAHTTPTLEPLPLCDSLA
jgi:hypothetical protein